MTGCLASMPMTPCTVVQPGNRRRGSRAQAASSTTRKTHRDSSGTKQKQKQPRTTQNHRTQPRHLSFVKAFLQPPLPCHPPKCLNADRRRRSRPPLVRPLSLPLPPLPKDKTPAKLQLVYDSKAPQTHTKSPHPPSFHPPLGSHESDFPSLPSRFRRGRRLLLIARGLAGYPPPRFCSKSTPLHLPHHIDSNLCAEPAHETRGRRNKRP